MATTGLTEAQVLNMASFASTFAQREVIRKYLDVYDDGYGFFDWMDFTKRSAPTKTATYDNLTVSSIFQTAIVKTTAGTPGAAGANKTIVFDATGAIPQVSETLLFPNYIKGYVYSVALNVNAVDYDVVIKPQGNVSIPGVTAGDQIVISGNAQGEGGKRDDIIRRSTNIKRSNNIHILTTKDKITDIAGATATEIEVDGSVYVVNKLKYEMLLRHRMEIANELLTSTKSSFLNAKGEMVYTTHGLRPSIKDGGFSFQTSGAGVFDVVTDQKGLVIAMDAARCGREYTLWAGQSLDLAIDTNSITNSALTGGAITYAAYNGNDKIALAMGVKSITFGGYVIHKTRFKPAEHNKLFGAPGYTTGKKEGYLIPADKVKTLGSNGSSQVIDRARIRYMEFNGMKDLRYFEWQGGGLSDNKNTDERVLETSVTSHQGLELTGIEQFGMVTLQ